MKIEHKDNQTELFITEDVKLDKVKSIRLDVRADNYFPIIQAEVCAMDDQTFEVANKYCEIQINCDFLDQIPNAMLAKEVKKRGMTIEQ